MKIKFEGKSYVTYLSPNKEYAVHEKYPSVVHGEFCHIINDDGDETHVGLLNSTLIEGDWIVVKEKENRVTEFKKGDIAKVVRKVSSHYGEIYEWWVASMDETIGKTGVVNDIFSEGDCVKVYFEDIGVGWVYSPCSLEKVSEETPQSSDNLVECDVQSKDTNPKDLIGSKKAKLSVIPAGVMFEIGLGLLEGACKYGRHNYRAAGVRSSVYYDATIGHLMDWWEGQDVDPDSGLNHVTKALSSLTVLRDAMLQEMLTDDRPPRSKVFKSDFNDKAASIIDIHSDKNPKHYTQKDIG